MFYKLKMTFKDLKIFDWKLFIALCLLSLVPAVIQTIETFIISTNVSTSGIDVIGQMEWYDLINETIQAFLIIPLYSVLNRILKKNEEEFSSNVFKTGLITFVLYTIFSIIVLIYGSSLIKFMNPNEVDINVVNRYLSLSTISFMIGIIISFSNVVFVVIGKAKNVYIMLIAKTIVTIISDFIIIPKFGIDGVAISNIAINIILSVVSVVLLIKEGYIRISWFKKDDIKTLKEWCKVGFFSGFQQFIANFVYAIMICKMVNMVAEQGNYWIANNFIWGWLLIPIYAITEVIRKDCKDGYNNLKQSNYYLVITMIVLLWIVSIPLWIPFFKYVERLENYMQIFKIVIMLFAFYIFYAFQQIPDGIFVGTGKTYLIWINSMIVNFVYYGVWFILYKTNCVSFDIETIIIMFGFGNVMCYGIALLEERKYINKIFDER